MRFKEYEITNTDEIKSVFRINTICNGQVVGTKTNKGIIESVAVTSDDTVTSDKIELSDGKKELRGFIKFDCDNSWHKFYGTQYVIIKPDFGDNDVSQYLIYYHKITAKLTIEVDEDIDIDSDDLRIIDGIGQARNTFDTIRDLIKYNCVYTTKMYTRSSLPDQVRKNIEERIKLQDVEREVLNREIIKHDIE